MNGERRSEIFLRMGWTGVSPSRQAGKSRCVNRAFSDFF